MIQLLSAKFVPFVRQELVYVYLSLALLVILDHSDDQISHYLSWFEGPEKNSLTSWLKSTSANTEEQKHNHALLRKKAAVGM